MNGSSFSIRLFGCGKPPRMTIELPKHGLRANVAESLSNAIRTAIRRQVLLNGGGTLSVNRAGVADYDMDFLKTQFLAAISEQGRVWTDREDAIRAFARWLGFRRTGSVIDETARKLISRLLRAGKLETDGNSIRRKP